MAEYRVIIFKILLRYSSSLPFQAAEDALHRLYLTRTPVGQLRLPSSAFSEDIFSQTEHTKEESYVPGELGHMEVAYGSAGRSSIVLPNNRSNIEDIDED